MANAPLSGQDGGSYSFDLPDERSGIFLRKGLDSFSYATTDLPVRHIGGGIEARSFALELSFDSRLVYDRPYFVNLFAAKFIEDILGK